MRVTFLGTGSAMPVPGRAQTGLLVGDDLLVDCGAGVLARLAEHGDYEALEAVLLTHLHTDHVSDLIPLLKARWLADSGPLTVVGPEGTEELIDDLLDAYDYLRRRVAVEVREHRGDPGSVAGYDVRATRATHSGPAFAYRVGNLAVSGDTEVSEAVLALAEGATALAHDCSFPAGVEVDNHPNAAELGDALAGRDCGTVYLTHLYPHAAADEGELEDAVAARYDGEVRVARDGLTVEV